MSDRKLPEFIPPMLAQMGEPFDSHDHLFEVKWDGTRALAFIDHDGYRLMNRRRINLTARYPDLAGVGELAAGTVLDGEIVVLDADGKASFNSLQVREQARTELKYKTLARSSPATFVIFDQLYHGYEPIMDQPLNQRRETLARTVRGAAPYLVFSEGVIGPGRDFFQQAVERDLEGVVAKRLSGRYLPGKRTESWIKIKKRNSILCAIIGYVPKQNDFESLALAAELDGKLQYVGRVGNGFDQRFRQELLRRLETMHVDRPIVPNKLKTAQWVEAKLFCFVRYLEMTKNRELRDPVFERLVSDAAKGHRQ